MKRRIIVITGEGKGKTTSAIGASVRALGRGFKVLFYQFIKSKDAEYGEHLFFEKSKKMNIVRLGKGCRKDFKYSEEDIKAAVKGLKRIDIEMHELLKKNRTKKQFLVVLDEVSYPVAWKWFDAKDVIKLMDKYADVNFILTGRSMSQEIIEVADTVSNIQENRHAYQKGLKAQIGVEF
ncbi:MAG: cob(I)yrinic acid a,c-diamide adenosyltransferase [Proteobacteria bacterium]|nr:cob(I)yrinic acid a,c-diamide adenosyltransferase [Pseudomonadota bacterium]